MSKFDLVVIIGVTVVIIIALGTAGPCPLPGSAVADLLCMESVCTLGQFAVSVLGGSWELSLQRKE